ncbi:hypothetical protein L53_15350 [Hyphomonas sp. L-53-1-40]|uniref:exopolysaccharide biosynthesis protein n=1 Tax=Hyphomonas sp. L-53-1-40 TaxID=1207058 RepID=UPI00045902E3|nr:exopolysaccharide biosynthesis protein [Hyphomonas sp. L-53-1-40]KCZ65568.1 hypothetical protein L53_15350 [Hyphomonas sp. L-53-1-40]
MPASQSDPLENVLETAIEEGGEGTISVGDLLNMFGHRSFGPIITLLGLLVVLPPLGGIPGLPAVIGVIILLFSIQILFGADHIWMPSFVEKRSIETSKLKEAEDKVKPWLERIDRMITERLAWATGSVATYLAAVAVSLLAMLMIPLELVPFAVAAPGVAIVLFGLALVAKDGALMLAGFAATAAALTITVMFVPWGQVAGWF